MRLRNSLDQSIHLFCYIYMMADSKYLKVRPSTFNGMLRRFKSKVMNRLHKKMVLVFLCGVSALVIMFGRDTSDGRTGVIDDFKRMISPTTEELLHRWNYSHEFRPKISQWDEQRELWALHHPNQRPRDGGKPWVMMVTGSFPKACDPTILSHLLLRSMKNKLDYTRMHDMKLYYSMTDEQDQDFSDWWMKLPLIRMLMLEHPDMEWIWWLDADDVITDMSFQPPYLEKSEPLHKNLVLYGNDRLVYDERSWTSLSTSNFMIRNCQWSLDLLDEWASMGTAGIRDDAGEFLNSVLLDRPLDFPADDQSSLVAVLARDKRRPVGKQRFAPMVMLAKDTEHHMCANWTEVAPKLENAEQVPFVTHFKGCLPSCNVKPEFSNQALDSCVEQLERAIDFADNQVYKNFGYGQKKLGQSLEPFERKLSNAEIKATAGNGGEASFSIPGIPRYTDWDERRQAWLSSHPSSSRHEALLVSGSAPKACPGPHGSEMLLRGLKNLIDYGRKNDVPLFYNNAEIDRNMTGWWSKLPLWKMLMVENPGVEWIWWLDSDAVITDLDYRLDFAKYNKSGFNVVMYGKEHEVYEKKMFNGINTGNFLIRNCQWSLDLLDRWGSFGATAELRKTNEALLNNFLSNRPPGWDADDQCVLVYLMIKEREKWGAQVGLENTIAMSGHWSYWTDELRDEFPKEKRPFVTHFAGCKNCEGNKWGILSDEFMTSCVVGMDKVYNFADNQVVGQYGLRHLNLNSAKVMQRSSILKDAIETQSEEKKPQVMEENVDFSLEEKFGTSEEETVKDFKDAKYEGFKEAKYEVKLETSQDEKVDNSKEDNVNVSNVSEDETVKDFKEAKYEGFKEAKYEVKLEISRDEEVNKSEEDNDENVDSREIAGREGELAEFQMAVERETRPQKEEEGVLELPEAKMAAAEQEEDGEFSI